VPRQLNELLGTGTEEQKSAVIDSFLQMKKLNIGKLEDAWHGA